MSQNSTATKTARSLYALEGTVAGVSHGTCIAKGGREERFATFRFTYGKTARDGTRRVETRTATAFGACVDGIAPALAAEGPVRLWCEFRTTKQGQSLKAFKIAPPRKQAGAQPEG